MNDHPPPRQPAEGGALTDPEPIAPPPLDLVPLTVVEIGHGVIPALRRRGIATKAVTALLEFAFRHPAVTTVQAETFPHLEGSIGVLHRAGFERHPEPGRGGTIRYRRSRSTAAVR